MPISSIVKAPAANSLNAAYRPIILQVSATATDGSAVPPVVYCDIYINNGFYKTISKTQYISNNGASSNWEFDLQDACQEYLGKYLGKNGGTGLEDATPLYASVYVCVRSSGINTDGFVEAEDTAPVQATGSTPAIPGGGWDTNSFYIINSSLRHEDNQDFVSHLNAFKTGDWAANAYPLSHRPSCEINIGQSDFFPIIADDDIDPCDGAVVMFYRSIDVPDGDTVGSSLSGGDCAATIDNINVSISGNNATITVASTGASSFLYYLDGGDVVSSSSNVFVFTGLSNGTHSFGVMPMCACAGGTPGFTDFDIDVACDNVVIADVPLPDAIVGVPYNVTLALVGTSPFGLGAVIKPDWMTINIVGSNLRLTGTPTETSTGQEISITVSNDCSDSSYSDSIDVTVPASHRIFVGYGTATGDICGSLHPVWISTDYDDIVPDMIVYTNSGLTTPLTGKTYIGNSASEVFHINSATGAVGATTGIIC